MSNLDIFQNTLQNESGALVAPLASPAVTAPDRRELIHKIISAAALPAVAAAFIASDVTDAFATA